MVKKFAVMMAVVSALYAVAVFIVNRVSPEGEGDPTFEMLMLGLVMVTFMVCLLGVGAAARLLGSKAGRYIEPQPRLARIEVVLAMFVAWSVILVSVHELKWPEAVYNLATFVAFFVILAAFFYDGVNSVHAARREADVKSAEIFE